MLDGYLTAIVSGPEMIPPSEWMPYLWQPDGGEHTRDSAAQAQRVLDLIVRHMNSIATLLMGDEDAYAPLLNDYDFEGVTVTFAQEWALGYLQGVGFARGSLAALVRPRLRRGLRRHRGSGGGPGG